MIDNDKVVDAVLSNPELSESEDILAKEKPKEVTELETILGDLSAYRQLIKLGMFPGSTSEIVEKLKNFIKGTYDQVLVQYHETAYIKALLSRKKKEKEALDKLEAEEQ